MQARPKSKPCVRGASYLQSTECDTAWRHGQVPSRVDNHSFHGLLHAHGMDTRPSHKPCHPCSPHLAKFLQLFTHGMATRLVQTVCKTFTPSNPLGNLAFLSRMLCQVPSLLQKASLKPENEILLY